VLNVKITAYNVNLIHNLLPTIEKPVHNVTTRPLIWIMEYAEKLEQTVYLGKWKEENVCNVNTVTD
jgi:hypothetical protein